MQVVEKSGEGLSRSYGVSVPAAELGAALDARIAEILPTLQLKGFRPGKVPKAHVKKLYGKALMGEVIEKTINETSQQVLSDHQLRIASSPDLKPVSDMDQVVAGTEDLAYDLEVEVMPDFEPFDVSQLKLTRPVYHSSEEEVAAALAELVAQNKTYAAFDDRAAQAGDQILMDFVGKIDGEPFEGGSAENAEIVLGSGQFIPGFEDGLMGAKGGSDVLVNVKFPADYGAERLAGKDAVFEVAVHEVRIPQEAVADDALAERLGMADLAALTDALRKNLDSEYAQASRFKLKRTLLDALDERHDIPLPPRMVEAEFAGIWTQVEKDKTDGQVSPEDAEKSDDELRAEYRKIAERRVRLGLVLAEIGRRANVQVTEAEIGDAMRSEAMRYGDQAQQIFDMMRQNQNYRAQIQAPLYEEKVVDHIVGLATVEDAPVSKEDLLKDDDLPLGMGAMAHDHDHDHDHDHHGHDHSHHDHDHDHDHAGHDHAHEAKPAAKAPAKKAKKAAVKAEAVEAAPPAEEAAPKKPAKPRAKKAAAPATDAG
jgi:trigger factor